MIFCTLFNKGWWPLTLQVLVVLSSVCLINMMLVSCHVLLKGWILDIIGVPFDFYSYYVCGHKSYGSWRWLLEIELARRLATNPTGANQVHPLFLRGPVDKLVHRSTLSMPSRVSWGSCLFFHQKFGKQIVRSPADSLLVPGVANFYPPKPSTVYLRPYGPMKTPGEFGAACSTHWCPYGLLKLSEYLWNRKGADRAP